MPEQIDLTEKKDGGVLKEILREGEGDATPGESCTVYVHYHGTLLDGTVFDSSRDRGQEFEFQLGMGQVIQSWDLGVASMKKGELAKLTCAAPYAYGENGSPPKIPPNATLVFEVELLRWSYEDISPEKDGSIRKKMITKGEMFTNPKDLSECTVHLRGTYPDAAGKSVVFDERDATFTVGEASLQKVCRGVELAVQKMKKGEKSEIFLRGKYASDESLPIVDGAGSEDKPLSYVVTLHNFEKPKESWEMNSDEKLEVAEKDKAKGTDHFKAGRLVQALKYYKRVRDFMQGEDRLEGEQKTKRDALFLSALLNLSLVYLKQDDCLEAIKACEEAQELDPKNVKALFRRGQAQLAINEYDIAVADFSRCIELEPENKAALSQLQLAKAKRKAQLDKEKKMFKAMFQKMAGSGESKGDGSASAGGDTDAGVWVSNDAAAAPVEAN